MGPETGRQGPYWREVGEVQQPVGRIEWGMRRELGEDLSRTRLLWVSREPSVEEAEAEAGCNVTSGLAPHPCPRLMNPMHCPVTW